LFIDIGIVYELNGVAIQYTGPDSGTDELESIMNPEADFPNTDHIRMSSPVTVTAYELFGYGVVNVTEALYDCPPKDAIDAEEAFMFVAALSAYDAVVAVPAVVAFVAHEAVPVKSPVIPCVTDREPVICTSDPYANIRLLLLPESIPFPNIKEYGIVDGKLNVPCTC
jgi:hypothetical protein